MPTYTLDDAITKEQIAYPDFIKVDGEVNNVYASVSWLVCKVSQLCSYRYC